MRNAVALTLVALGACTPPSTAIDQPIDATPDGGQPDMASTDASPPDMRMADAAAPDAQIDDAAGLDASPDMGDTAPDAAVTPRVCSVDADCRRSHRCIDGRCRWASVGAPCEVDAHCLEELHCADGTCFHPSIITHRWAYWRDGTLFAGVVVESGGASLLLDGERLRPTIIESRFLAGGGRLEYLFEVRRDRRPAEVAFIGFDGIMYDPLPVEDQPVRGPDEACRYLHGADSCAEGHLCLPPADQECHRSEACVGAPARCVPAMPAVVHDAQERLVLRVRGGPYRADEPLTVNDMPLVLQRAPRLPDDTAIFTAHRGLVGSRGEIRHGADRVLVVDDPPPPALRAEGDPCDQAGLFDHCAEGLACGPATCTPAVATVIEEAVLITADDGFAFWVRGRDPNQDIEGWHVTDRGSPVIWGDFVVPLIGGNFWRSGFIDWDGEVFEAMYSEAHPLRSPPQAAELRLDDSTGSTARPFDSVVTAPAMRPPVAADERCDFTGLARPCPAETICDVVDGGDDTPRCRALEPRCPDGLARPLQLDQPLRVETLIETHHRSETGCRGDPTSPAHYFEFTPPADGNYVFSAARDGPVGVALRAGCLLRHSALTCAAEERLVDGVASAVIEAQLVAGETVTLIVDEPWPSPVRLGDGTWWVVVGVERTD